MYYVNILFIFFVRDEDMQSLASLMSLDKITDIGQLKDVEYDDDDAAVASEDAAAKISALASEIGQFSSVACNDISNSHTINNRSKGWHLALFITFIAYCKL